MEANLSGTLAIDLGNTNTVIAFQDQKNINPILVEIPGYEFLKTVVFKLNSSILLSLNEYVLLLISSYVNSDVEFWLFVNLIDEMALSTWWVGQGASVDKRLIL